MKSGMVSEQDAKQMLTELQNSKYECDANYAFPRQAQIYGYK
jgi:flagellum-specific peptidoglycan hydrolase FlgJ